MGRVSTDRKVCTEHHERDCSSSSCSLPATTNGEFAFSRTTTSKGNNCSASAGSTTAPSATTATTDGASSTIRSSLRKLSSLPNNYRKKGFTKLGSRNDYEQIWEREEPPSSDTTHATSRIFSAHHGSNTSGSSGTSGASSHHHCGEGEVVVMIDDAPGARAEPTSNGTNFVAWSGGSPRQSRIPSAEQVTEQLSSPNQPLLKKVDSFDEDHHDDENFRTRNTVSSPRATAGAGVNSPGLPRHRKVEFTGSCRRDTSGGSGLQSEGSYDFRNDLPRREGCWSAECRPSGATDSTSSNSSRPKSKSFDFGTVPEDDPPTKLIGAFLRRQTESGSNFLDLDLEMEELTVIPMQTPSQGNLSAADSDREGTPRPEKNSFVKDSSYADLVLLDRPVTSSVPTTLKAGAPPSPSAEEVWRWKQQSQKTHSDSLAWPQDVTPDVRINLGAGDEAARGSAATRSPSPQNGTNGLESPSSAGVRLRRNGSFRQSPSPPRLSAGGEVLKAPAQYFVRTSFSRQKSRLADLPKPPEGTRKASGAIDESKMKSGQMRNSRELKSGGTGSKLKKVEEEEEDPLKDTDLPEKYRKRESGFLTIVQYSALLIVLAAIACTLSIPRLKKIRKGGLVLWKWVVLCLVVFCGRLICGWMVWVVVFIIEKNFLLRKRVVYFVYALRKGVQNSLWLGFALLAWHFMIDPKVDNNVKVVKVVTKVLVCFLVAAMIVLVKTFIVKVFASSFHVNNYFERIQEALLNQYIMETLAGPPMVEYEQELNDEKRLVEEIAGLRDAGASGPSLSRLPNLPPIATRTSGLPPRPSVNTKSAMMGTQSGMIGSQPQSGKIGNRTPKAGEAKRKSSGSKAELSLGISIDHLQKLDISNISAWNMKRLIHVFRNSTLTHSLEETVSSAECAETEIQSEWQAKVKAKQIFRNVAKPGQKLIMEDDLLRFMDEELAKKALDKFEGACETKQITKQALKKWAIDVYKERRAVAYSLNDTKTAVNKLHRMIDVIVCLVVIIVWLLVLGIATTKFLLFLSSQLLLLILVWGNTLKTVFEAVVFLFVMHPFDVGDRCVIDGMQLVVEEMNILSTVFLGDFNVKISYPNAVLATKPIQNFFRSPEMGDSVELMVQAGTPVEKIATFKEKIGKYILSKPNYWHQDYSLNVLQMTTEGEKMKLGLGLQHTTNWQDFGEIVKRRSELFLEVQLNLQELGIEYHLPAQEVLVRQPAQELLSRQRAN